MLYPYLLGCPQWQHTHWNSHLPKGSSPLQRYAQVFSTVEGNTTFYATPSASQCEQWRSQVPDHFRFLFKFPRAITHEQRLDQCQTEVAAFLNRLAPLHDVLGPMLLQFSARFSPKELPALWRFLDELPASISCTIEVRHPDFFAKGESERALNRGLRERDLSRVCFDSRGLFAAEPTTDSIRDAQRKKPQVPVHVLPSAASPVVRFIGHPELAMNPQYLAPWVARFKNWIDEQKMPVMLIHMPDNAEALALAQQWHEMLRQVLPAMPPLPLVTANGTQDEGQNEKQPQQGLF